MSRKAFDFDKKIEMNEEKVGLGLNKQAKQKFDNEDTVENISQIPFEDKEVERICHEHGVYTYDDAKKVESLERWFKENTVIETFNEMRFFTGLKEIEDCAFDGCYLLKSVIIPDSVKTIGNNAFSDCVALQEIIIPDSVTSIEKYAFYRCESLKSIGIPSNITFIGSTAFGRCCSIKKVTIPKHINCIEPQIFMSCKGLEEVYIQDGVETIGNGAFSWCSSLKTISIPSSVKTIGTYLFYECPALKTIYISKDCPAYYKIKDEYPNPNIQLVDPSEMNESHALGLNKQAKKKFNDVDAVDNVGYIKFEDPEVERICHEHGVYTVDDAGKVSSIKEWFVRNKNIVSFNEFKYFTGLKTIEKYVFSACSHLQSIKIPDSVTRIEERVFLWCENLQSIKIPNSVTIIEDRAFLWCENLQSINIPDSVIGIGDYAFDYCISLRSIYISKNCLVYNKIKDVYPNIQLVDPSEMNESHALGLNKQAKKKFNDVDAVDNVGYIKFEDPEVERICHEHGVYTVDDAAGVTSLEGWFINNEDIKSFNELKWFTGLKEIEKEAFRKCRSLKEVTIPDSVTSIGKFTFSACNALKFIHIPDSVTSIGNSAFFYCDSLQSINIPSSVTNIGDNAFSYCKSLKSVIILNGVTSIGDYAFSDCYSLQSINIPDSMTSIGYEAFNSCRDLKKIYISKSCPVYSVIMNVKVKWCPKPKLVDPSKMNLSKMNEAHKLGLNKQAKKKFDNEDAIENISILEKDAFIDMAIEYINTNTKYQFMHQIHQILNFTERYDCEVLRFWNYDKKLGLSVFVNDDTFAVIPIPNMGWDNYLNAFNLGEKQLPAVDKLFKVFDCKNDKYDQDFTLSVKNLKDEVKSCADKEMLNENISLGLNKKAKGIHSSQDISDAAEEVGDYQMTSVKEFIEEIQSNLPNEFKIDTAKGPIVEDEDTFYINDSDIAFGDIIIDNRGENGEIYFIARVEYIDKKYNEKYNDKIGFDHFSYEPTIATKVVAKKVAKFIEEDYDKRWKSIKESTTNLGLNKQAKKKFDDENKENAVEEVGKVVYSVDTFLNKVQEAFEKDELCRHFNVQIKDSYKILKNKSKAEIFIGVMNTASFVFIENSNQSDDPLFMLWWDLYSPKMFKSGSNPIISKNKNYWFETSILEITPIIEFIKERLKIIFSENEIFCKGKKVEESMNLGLNKKAKGIHQEKGQDNAMSGVSRMEPDTFAEFVKEYMSKNGNLLLGEEPFIFREFPEKDSVTSPKDIKLEFSQDSYEKYWNELYNSRDKIEGSMFRIWVDKEKNMFRAYGSDLMVSARYIGPNGSYKDIIDAQFGKWFFFDLTANEFYKFIEWVKAGFPKITDGEDGKSERYCRFKKNCEMYESTSSLGLNKKAKEIHNDIDSKDVSEEIGNVYLDNNEFANSFVYEFNNDEILNKFGFIAEKNDNSIVIYIYQRKNGVKLTRGGITIGKKEESSRQDDQDEYVCHFNWYNKNRNPYFSSFGCTKKDIHDVVKHIKDTAMILGYLSESMNLGLNKKAKGIYNGIDLDKATEKAGRSDIEPDEFIDYIFSAVKEIGESTDFNGYKVKTQKTVAVKGIAGKVQLANILIKDDNHSWYTGSTQIIIYYTNDDNYLFTANTIDSNTNTINHYMAKEDAPECVACQVSKDIVTPFQGVTFFNMTLVAAKMFLKWLITKSQNPAFVKMEKIEESTNLGLNKKAKSIHDTKTVDDTIDEMNKWRTKAIESFFNNLYDLCEEYIYIPTIKGRGQTIHGLPAMEFSDEFYFVCTYKGKTMLDNGLYIYITKLDPESMEITANYGNTNDGEFSKTCKLDDDSIFNCLKDIIEYLPDYHYGTEWWYEEDNEEDNIDDIDESKVTLGLNKKAKDIHNTNTDEKAIEELGYINNVEDFLSVLKSYIAKDPKLSKMSLHFQTDDTPEDVRGTSIIKIYAYTYNTEYLSWIGFEPAGELINEFSVFCSRWCHEYIKNFEGADEMIEVISSPYPYCKCTPDNIKRLIDFYLERIKIVEEEIGSDVYDYINESNTALGLNKRAKEIHDKKPVEDMTEDMACLSIQDFKDQVVEYVKKHPIEIRQQKGMNVPEETLCLIPDLREIFRDEQARNSIVQNYVKVDRMAFEFPEQEYDISGTDGFNVYIDIENMWFDFEKTPALGFRCFIDKNPLSMAAFKTVYSKKFKVLDPVNESNLGLNKKAKGKFQENSKDTVEKLANIGIEDFEKMFMDEVNAIQFSEHPEVNIKCYKSADSNNGGEGMYIGFKGGPGIFGKAQVLVDADNDYELVFITYLSIPRTDIREFLKVDENEYLPLTYDTLRKSVEFVKRFYTKNMKSLLQSLYIKESMGLGLNKKAKKEFSKSEGSAVEDLGLLDEESFFNLIVKYMQENHKDFPFYDINNVETPLNRKMRKAIYFYNREYKKNKSFNPGFHIFYDNNEFFTYAASNGGGSAWNKGTWNKAKIENVKKALDWACAYVNEETLNSTLDESIELGLNKKAKQKHDNENAIDNIDVEISKDEFADIIMNSIDGFDAGEFQIKMYKQDNEWDGSEFNLKMYINHKYYGGQIMFYGEGSTVNNMFKAYVCVPKSKTTDVHGYFEDDGNSDPFGPGKTSGNIYHKMTRGTAANLIAYIKEFFTKQSGTFKNYLEEIEKEKGEE